MKPRRFCSEDRQLIILLHVCSQTADSALTHVWPCSDDTDRPLVPPHADLSQGSLLTLHARTDNTNRQYYLEHMDICLRVHVRLSVLSLQGLCSGHSDGQPSDGGPDGDEAEGRDVSTRRWLRSVNQSRTETSCWLSAKNIIYSVSGSRRD